MSREASATSSAHLWNREIKNFPYDHCLSVNLDQVDLDSTALHVVDMAEFGSSSASKIEREQAKRRDELLKRKKLEEKLANEARRREEEMLENSRIRKLAEAEEELKRQAQAEEESILTGGIRYCETLTVFKLDATFEDDKVILPEAALISLTEQDALSKGVLLFELTSYTGSSHNDNASATTKTTHCGVREFSAQPKMIGLPPKVWDSLTPDHEHAPDSAQIGKIIARDTIKYVRLPKITYIKLRPKTSTFFNVGPVKLCLEENLQKHTTLTLNDVITVWYKGVAHVLRVVEMLPESRGTVIDSDIEVDLDVSEENAKREADESSNTASSMYSTSTGSKIDPPVAVFASVGAHVGAAVGGLSQAIVETDEQRKARIREARLSRFN